MIRCTAKVRIVVAAVVVRGEAAAVERHGSTIRSLLVPWLSTYPITMVASVSIASRSAAIEPLGVRRSAATVGRVALGPVAGPDGG